MLYLWYNVASILRMPCVLHVACSDLFTKSFNLGQKEVDIGRVGCRVRDDHSEEVGQVTERLVAHHRRARLHHHRFNLGSHLNSNSNSNLKYFYFAMEIHKDI